MTSTATPISTTSPTASNTGLSVAQGSALTIGAVLGTGVLALPAVAATVAGPASLVAWLGLVLLSIPLSATFAALGARFPDGGGVSTFARQAFGAKASAAVGWCFYFAIPVGAPPAASFAGFYVADSLGGGRTTELLTAAALIAVVTGMNWFGIRISGRVQLLIAGVLATMLAVATLVSLPHADLGNLTPFAPHGWGSVGAAAALLVWAFAGWEAVSSLSGDYRNPGRDVPRATMVALVVVATLYLGIAFATVTVLGPNPGSAPLSDLLVLGFGEVARPVTTIAAVLLSLGAINAYFAGGARLGAALGRDGALPEWLAHGSAAGQVPRRSLLVVSGMSLATLAVVGISGAPLAATILVVTGAFTLVYVVGTAAAVKLLPRGTWVHRGAIVSFVATLALLWMTGYQVIGAVIVAALAVIWTIRTSERQLGEEPPA